MYLVYVTGVVWHFILCQEFVVTTIVNVWIIGVSLSESHTSGDCFEHVCVYLASYACLLCLFGTMTNVKFHEDQYCMHEACERFFCQSSVSDPERRQLKLKHAWQLVCAFLKLSQLWTMADKLYCSLLMDGRHGGWSCFTRVRAVYKLHSRDSAHDMVSPCMCPSLVHACVLA